MATASGFLTSGPLEWYQTSNETPHVVAGPLLTWIESLRAQSLGDYEQKGGLGLLRQIRADGRDASLRLLDEANVRGRAGGGFPVALKWWLLAEAEARPRYFICNAACFHRGFGKERYLLSLNPYLLVESLVTGAYLAGADEILLAVSEHLSREEMEAIERVIREFGEVNELLGREGGVPTAIRKVPARYITGEETALLEALEGKEPQPRRKPGMPISSGYRKLPTVVSNLESVVQAALALQLGAAAYRTAGTEAAPGTLLFNVTGDVERPGLYEAPLGTNLRDLVYRQAGGPAGGERILMVFPGGLCSAPVRAEGMDIALDFDSLREAGLELGSGNVIVVSESRDLAAVAIQLADFYSAASCGKCYPCQDGTLRTSVMFRRLRDLDQLGVDWEHKTMPASKRATLPPILNGAAPAGISYTDDVRGLDKIVNMCEFFKHRGDCHFSVEAATVMQTLTNIFREELEESRRLAVSG